MPVSSGYPLMIILPRGWICVASLRKRWPSANEIFILYSNKAQRVKKGNLARGKRALLKKKLEYTFDLHEFCFWQYPRILMLPAVPCLINHIDYMINQINTVSSTETHIFAPPPLFFEAKKIWYFGPWYGYVRYHCFTWLDTKIEMTIKDDFIMICFLEWQASFDLSLLVK